MRLLIVFILSSVLFWFSKAEEKVFRSMGTYLIVDTDGEHYDIYRYVSHLEQLLSDYIDSSEVSKINLFAGKSCVEVSPETLEVIRTSIHISQLTEGAFDITVGSITINHRRKNMIDFETAKGLVDYRQIKIMDNKVCLLKERMAIDLGGIGKGFAVQKVYEKFRDRLDRGFVALAGDLKVWGQKRELGIYNPLSKDILAKLVNRKDLCMSTSGNYFQEHIVGKTTDIVQVTVVYDDCSYTDALATAIFAMEKGQREKFLDRNQSFGVLILYKDGSVWLNRRFVDYFEIVQLF